HEIEAAPLETRVVVGMLDEQPCSGGPVPTDEALARPAVALHDNLQPLGVGLVDVNHLVHGLALIGTDRQPLLSLALALAHELDQRRTGSLVRASWRWRSSAVRLGEAARQIRGEAPRRSPPTNAPTTPSRPRPVPRQAAEPWAPSPGSNRQRHEY